MQQKYIKLENGTIVPVSKQGFITLPVSMSLSSLIRGNLEDIQDAMSIQATGSSLLTDISYVVKDHTGDSIIIDLTGNISELDVEEVNLDEMPNLDWNIEVTRADWGSTTIKVFAKTAGLAIKVAEEDPWGLVFSEKNAEYTFVATKRN
jgi:hypothetical protein